MVSTSEKQGDGRPANLPGVYRREDGSEMVTTKDPSFGRIQGDAFVQQGYTWVGDHSILDKKPEKAPTK